MKDYDLLLIIIAGILFFLAIFMGTIHILGTVFKPVPTINKTFIPTLPNQKKYQMHTEDIKRQLKEFREKQKQILRDYKK